MLSKHTDITGFLFGYLMTGYTNYKNVKLVLLFDSIFRKNDISNWLLIS